ncbi:hypothetical protein BH10BDE1_BH10BDE1_01050 [soil metagenome]
MSNSRRNFIKRAAQIAAGAHLHHILPAAAGLSAMTSQAFAQAMKQETDFNFVLFRVIGGMDSTLGIHPWIEDSSRLSEDDLWLNYDPRVEVQKNILGTQISLGPSAAGLAPFAKKMAVVRGIYMGASDLGHPAAIQHISSGRTQESAPHWSAYIGQKYTTPGHFVVTNTAIQRGVVNSFPIILTQALKAMGDVAEFSTSSSLDLYQDQGLQVNRYLDLLKQKAKLLRFAEVMKSQTQGSGEPQDETIALASLAAGLSRVAQIDLIDQAKDLDTHGGHVMHREYQKLRWDRIAAFLKGLVDTNLMEKTLVVVVSEFNRSPGKNANEGKDHNYSDNAVALFGRGLNGGSLIGDRQLYVKSDKLPLSVWAGSFIDYKTGRVSEVNALRAMQNSKTVTLPKDVNLIRPADLWATVARSFGNDLNKIMPPDSHTIPGLFSFAPGETTRAAATAVVEELKSPAKPRPKAISRPAPKRGKP